MSRLQRGILVPVIAATIVITLAACAPPVRPGHSRTHAAGHSATPVSTPTPAATRPALADLLLSTQGLGPIHLGSPVPATPAPLAIVQWDATKCVSADLGIAAGDPNAGAWATTFPDQPGSLGLGAPFIVTMVSPAQTSNVNLVWVWAPGIHTAPGIQVGSTLAQLHAAYATFSRTISGGVSDVYVVDATTGSLSFEVSKQDSSGGNDYWPADQVGKVLWMGATSPGTSLRPIAASDGGPSPCPSAA